MKIFCVIGGIVVAMIVASYFGVGQWP